MSESEDISQGSAEIRAASRKVEEALIDLSIAVGQYRGAPIGGLVDWVAVCGFRKSETAGAVMAFAPPAQLDYVSRGLLAQGDSLIIDDSFEDFEVED